MKQITLALAAIFAFQILPAQDVVYVLFNRDCMNQLEYRYSYPNLKGENSVWAYSMKPNVQEHYIFMTSGGGHYSPELPEGTVTCRNLDLDDAFVAGINRETQQMLIVFQRQSGGYWLMPVESATLVARKGSRYWVHTYQSSFQFDSLRMVNEQNLAVTGSPTAAYFSGAKLNNCLTEFSFHCEPVKSGQIRADLQFIPSIGIVNDRTGTSASKAMENELQLVKVNGQVLDDFIAEACPAGATKKIAMSKNQKPAQYGRESVDPDKEISSIMQKEQDEETPAEYSNVGDIQCAEDWEPGTHIVQKGENLSAIARTYKVTAQQLMQWNKIQNPDRIEVCQKLWLKKPPANAKKQSANKGTKAKEPDDETEEEAQPKGKLVTPQGVAAQKKRPTVKAQTTKPSAQKSYDPNRPIVYSDGDTDENDYQYFDPEEETDGSRPPRIHTVRRGEYLLKIAKMYGCPEECIRMANTMPLEGDEPLSIGQEIIIPDCTCSVDGKLIKKPAAAKKPVVKKQNSGTGQSSSGRPKPRRILDDDAPEAVEYGYDDERDYNNDDRYEETSLYEDDADRKGNSKSAKVQLYKEHFVKQGETLRSIAAKYKVDAAKLAKANGLKAKEEPVPGKTFLIPIEEDEEKDEWDDRGSGVKDEGYDPYNYADRRSDVEYDLEKPSTYSADRYAKKGRTPNTGGPAQKKRSSAARPKPNPTSAYPSNSFITHADGSETDLDRRTGAAAESSRYKQKRRNSILDDDASEPDPKPEASSPINDDDRSDDDVIRTSQPKKKLVKKGGTSPTDPHSFQHLVKKGETIQTIAEKHGVDASEIALINDIGLKENLIPGKRIWIPIESGK
ncbi:MAG: LysM peptidoglycan-binding domain-containing protein [Saprospiraceae bacterium]